MLQLMAVAGMSAREMPKKPVPYGPYGERSGRTLSAPA